MNDSGAELSLAQVVAVLCTLLGLLGASAALTAFPAAPWKTGASLLIAAIKTGVVVAYFMKLRAGSPLVRIFAAVGCCWLAIGAVLTFSDYLTR